MVIHNAKGDTKYDQILQNSSQEPSTSSKCDCVLDALIIMLGSWNWNTHQEWHIMLNPDVKFDTKDDPILQNSSQELLKVLKVLLCSWYTNIYAREWKLVYNSIITYYKI